MSLEQFTDKKIWQNYKLLGPMAHTAYNLFEELILKMSNETNL